MLRRRPLSRFQQGSRNGFTLVELLVVMALLTLISAILLGLVSQSSALVAKGTQTIALNQKARFALDKMAPYVVTAVAHSGASALIYPRDKDDPLGPGDKYSYTTIRFTTRENFLDPDYNPAESVWTATVDNVFYYEIAFDDETNPTPYTLENGTSVPLGKIVLRKYTDSTFGLVDSTYPERPLAYNVQYFYCHMLTDNSLKVFVRTVGKRRGPSGNQIDVFEEAQGILSVPSTSYD